MKFLDRIFAPKKKDTEKEIEIEELISITDPEDQTDYYKPKKKNTSHDENSPNGALFFILYGETHSPSVEKGAHNAKLLNDHRYDRTAIRSGLSSNRARRSYFHSDITVTKRLIR